MYQSLYKILSLFLCFCLILEQGVFAQTIDLSHYFARNPTQTIPHSDKFRPLHLRYISYDNQANDFKILLDKGDFFNQKTERTLELEQTTQELMKYFFIGLSLPNEKFWVNLRPDSPDNILDPELEKTDIGRIFLEADVQLKKDTAGMTSPQTPEGKAYWNKLYKKAGELFGSENITIPTITRPWIVPNEIIIREAPDNAYIYKATLKVMLEEDYLRGTIINYSFNDPRLKELNQYSTQLIKELIIPKLTQEINSSKRYAPLRQVYYSLIFAQHFKKKFSQSTGENPYVKLIDSRNLINLTSKELWDKRTYFKDYQKSFQEGEYNLKAAMPTAYGQSVRSYVSGGISLNQVSSAIETIQSNKGRELSAGIMEKMLSYEFTAGSSVEPYKVRLEANMVSSALEGKPPAGGGLTLDKVKEIFNSLGQDDKDNASPVSLLRDPATVPKDLPGEARKIIKDEKAIKENGYEEASSAVVKRELTDSELKLLSSIKAEMSKRKIEINTAILKKIILTIGEDMLQKKLLEGSDLFFYSFDIKNWDENKFDTLIDKIAAGNIIKAFNLVPYGFKEALEIIFSVWDNEKLDALLSILQRNHYDFGGRFAENPRLFGMVIRQVFSLWDKFYNNGDESLIFQLVKDLTDGFYFDQGFFDWFNTLSSQGIINRGNYKYFSQLFSNQMYVDDIIDIFQNLDAQMRFLRVENIERLNPYFNEVLIILPKMIKNKNWHSKAFTYVVINKITEKYKKLIGVDMSINKKGTYADLTDEAIMDIITPLMPEIKKQFAQLFNDHMAEEAVVLDRCREMIKGGSRGISLHVGSGNSILPVVDALLGFTVIVSDSYLPNMKLLKDIIKSNKNISDKIEEAGGKIISFEALDIKGKDSSKIRLTDFGENSIDHITITNVFNSPGSDFNLYQVVEVIKDIFSILKKGGTITTDKNAAIGGIEMTFLKQHPEYTTDKVLLGQGTFGNNFYLFHLKDKKVVSSSITKASKPSLRIDDNKGGIAFNALPIQTESVASSALWALPGGRAFKGDLDAEWTRIQDVFNAGIRPSIQRLSEYTAAAIASPLAEDKIDQVRVMLADILRRDEESQKLAPAEESCKQLLRAIEAG